MLAALLLFLYVFSLYQRGTSWRFAPDLRIAVLSEPLASITREITGDLASVELIPYPLTGSGALQAAENVLQEAHIFIVPRLQDVEGLALPGPSTRLVALESTFPHSFQFPLLQNNRQFFTYASAALEEQMVTSIRDKLVDMDVVRAGKYEVASKRLRDRIKKEGSLGFESAFRLP